MSGEPTPSGQQSRSMPQEQENGQTWEVCYYVVAFVDILSQKDSLAKLVDIPSDDPETKVAFNNGLRDTLGAVLDFRWMFDTFYAAAATPIELPDHLTAEVRTSVEQLTKAEVIIQRVSDTLIFAVPLAENRPLPVNGVLKVFQSCAAAFLGSMAHQQVFRGGIELATAWQIEPGDIYGPALYLAHWLESEVAQYPRIVVGKRLVEYLQLWATHSGQSPAETYARDIAKRSHALLTVDVDGHSILDYLGDTFRKSLPADVKRDWATDVLPEAYAFLRREVGRFRLEQNTKLAFRYSVMQRYYDQRMPAWMADDAVEEPS